jgi:hypothetical protein
MVAVANETCQGPGPNTRCSQLCNAMCRRNSHSEGKATHFRLRAWPQTWLRWSGERKPTAIEPRRLLRVAQLAVFAAFFAAAAPAGAGTAAAADGPCSASDTRGVAFAFARAWTRGDVAAIGRLVALEPHFRWVSAAPPGGRSGARAFDRSTLGAFIRARHVQHERLTLKSFKFNGSDLRGTEGFGHFEFEAVRLSDDRPAGADTLRAGKGAIICTLARPMIAVWSLG